MNRIKNGMTLVKCAALMAVMIAWMIPARAQTDYSGVYYIGGSGYNASNPANNYYLCPTEGWIYYKPTDNWDTDGTTYPNPFLTTYKCKTSSYHSGNSSDAVWIIEKASGQNYYYIKQASTGKYMVSNGQITGTSNANRMRVHLEEVAEGDLDDKELFSIEPYSTYLVISPKSSAGWNGNNKWYTVNNGNKDYLVGNESNGGPAGYTATGGIIGLYTQSDSNAKFYLEPATVAPPSITNNFDNTITITAVSGATIYYTTDGTTPTTSSSVYSTAITLTDAITVVKAIAKATNDYFPSFVTTYNIPMCEKPVITVADNTVSITCVTPNATIYYTNDNTQATTSSTLYSGSFSLGDATIIRAIATSPGYIQSNETVYAPPLTVHSSSEIVDMSRSYILASDFTSTAPIGTATSPFTGTIDGQLNTFSGFTNPLVAYANGAVIKNVILKNVSINGSGNVGAIANEITGTSSDIACIYNCGILSGSVGGSNHVGGIVGDLGSDSNDDDCYARVINCYSYATITGGACVAGIVGYNSYESKSDDIRTMVMNCMFYGDITGGTVVSPVYGGEKITNKGGDSKGLNNFNYFCYEDFTHAINEYNCALGAEKRFLTRFEFHRILLNSNRELAAWYATGIADRSVMAKWVLDKSIAPYPILKIQDTYPSVVNPDYANAVEGKPRNQGGKLGTLTVKIQMGNGEHFDHPGTGDDEAQITTSQLILNITDKDTANFNYNYGKVQLPYYNQVGSKNYTGNRVVTGWKIVDVKGGEKGTFIDADEFGGRNFADREHWAKDFYGNGGANRIFNQGAYWEVPTDVYEITIEPYWAKCVYLSDPYYDVTYVGDAPTAIETMGQRYVNGNDYAINGSSQKVYTTVSNARTALASNTNHTPFDYAIVLVGNYHHFQHNVNTSITGSKYTNNVSLPYTFMSVDLDLDNEPDNVLLYQHGYLRTGISPVRFDFLHITGIGMAQKEDGIEYIPEAGTFWNYGWFEITNTSLIKLSQIEYVTQKKVNAPLILQGGMYENVYSFQGTEGAGNTPYTPYIHVGGNAFFNMFSNGSHLNNHDFTPHVPISVTGGDYDVFYLSGYRLPKEGTPDAGSDDAECYIDGGRFGEVAGAAMWQVDGNVGWSINNADIKDFYGGGINAEKPVTGTITTTIRNSYVDMFCGGPKFGDMTDGKAVSTTATGCTFGTFFGAGYGGTSAKRVTGTENNNVVNTEFNGWTGWLNQYFDRQYHNDGIAARYELIFFQYSGGGSLKNVAQIYINRVMFSLATTRGVTSTLTDCTINGNFYGGGNLGKVLGNTTSTLTDCHVGGSVFGAGFSVSIPKVDVYAKPASGYTAPYCDGDAGVYIPAVYPTPTVYTWKHANSVSAGHEFEDVGDKHYILTTEDLTTLGTVTGDVSLTIQGNSTVHGSVFGGGDESAVLRAAGGDNGNTLVKILGKTKVFGNIYGGGNMGLVGGNTKVIINGKYTEQGTGTNGGNH